jgi:Kdo2-lipid IVA lauroyltransferase/acyltransferase
MQKMACLPHARLQWLGRAVGAVIMRLPWKRRHIARQNISICLPQLSVTEQSVLLQKSMYDLGYLLTEFIEGWFAPAANVAKIRYSISGLEHVLECQAASRGVILVGGHFSHLELCGRLLTQQIELAGMYREYPNPAFEAAILQARLAYASAMFRRDELRPAVRYLQQGGVLWYAPDHDYLRGDPQFVPFFNVPAATITATHQLARLSGAAVIGFFHSRRPDGSYQLRLTKPLENFPSADKLTDTTRVNQLIEEMIRAAPEQYLWIHKRFKRRPPGSDSIY